MAIPDYQSVIVPLLRYAGDKEEHSIREATDSLADEFHLTEQERKELLPSGRQAIFRNRAGWARTYLKMARLIESTRRGRPTEESTDLPRALGFGLRHVSSARERSGAVGRTGLPKRLSAGGGRRSPYPANPKEAHRPRDRPPRLQPSHPTQSRRIEPAPPAGLRECAPGSHGKRRRGESNRALSPLDSHCPS